jgi:hypothetical protein
MLAYFVDEEAESDGLSSPIFNALPSPVMTALACQVLPFHSHVCIRKVSTDERLACTQEKGPCSICHEPFALRDLPRVQLPCT